MSVMSRIKSVLDGLEFLLRNSLRIWSAADFKSHTMNGIIYKGYHWKDKDQIAKLYAQLNGNARIGLFNWFLYGAAGGKLMLTASRMVGQERSIIAMNMYYLNRRDFEESTVHEGFIGVVSEFEGKGIATQMRKLAKEHFEKAGFNGISTRISKNNFGSLASAKKLGFRTVEEYYDKALNEERCYLICDLRQSS